MSSEIEIWGQISSLHELLWTDAMNYKHGHSKYDKISIVNSVDRQVKALVASLLTEARLDELKRISNGQSIVEANDSDYPYYCESCGMMPEAKDDICACERLTHHRIQALNTNTEDKT